jgi:putative redox protein
MKVVARRREGYTHDVEIEGGHTLVMDEPTGEGGADLGPSPTRTLGAALAACTAITCEMYAERKGWELGDVEVDVEIEYDQVRHAASGFEVTLRITAPLDDDQQESLRVIAGKCPVHRIISGQTPVAIVDRIECQPAG